MRFPRFAVAISCAVLTMPISAHTAEHTAAEEQVLELTKQAISLRSVEGEGNKTPEVAALFRDALIKGGWAAKDFEIERLNDTAYLIATWHGSDPSLKPIVISAHMDVVEADPKDWERDPFTPIVENGYLYGRGASDTKFDAVLAMVSLIELRRMGYQPKRSVIIAYSGDEETTMDTSKVIAERLKDAAMVINVDGSSGSLDEETGEPSVFFWQGAEKSYVDFQLEVTNHGGHSSAPEQENAIVQLSTALERIGNYHFAPEINDITRASLEGVLQGEKDPNVAAALRTFLADKSNKDALAILRASPVYVGQIGTTCVPTMIHGGHALNALPQRATANINCRVFPGHSREEIMAELQAVAAVPEVVFTDMTGDDSTESAASPLDEELVAVMRKALDASWGEGIPIFPIQSAGATDSMWYRALGVPSYGASGTMMKDSDQYAHGLNERVPLVNIKPGLLYYLSLFQDLTSK